MAGLRIEISSLFAGTAPAAAIAAVIEDEHADAGCQQRLTHVKAMANVARVTMAKEHREGCARRIRVARKKPSIQVDTVFGLEPNVLKRPAQFSAGCGENTVGMINLRMFKPAQHKNKKQTDCQQPGDCLKSFSPLLHRISECHKQSRETTS